MTMQEVIARINELAKKAKAEGLTDEETKEREALRNRYIASVRENLSAQLGSGLCLLPARHESARPAFDGGG